MLGRYLVIVGYITTAVDINEVRIYMFLFVFLRFFCYEMHNNFLSKYTPQSPYEVIFIFMSVFACYFLTFLLHNSIDSNNNTER